jgi:ribosomal-protein-alanine N-acetyltransferase
MTSTALFGAFMPHFRPLLSSDFSLIYPIEQAAHREPWRDANLRSCFGPRYLNGLLLVADEPVGFYISDLVAGDSSLMNICVHPDRQGQGWGRALLQEYLRHSKSLGAQAWFLEVRASNQGAMSLYERAGFAEYCRRTDYYGSGNTREDAVLMSRLFDF